MPTTTTRRKPKTSKPKRPSGSPGSIASYADALKWLHSHTDYERMRTVRYNPATFSLERVRKLLKSLGNPQDQLQAVHVAGSKGKGSTCAMLDSMLQACGYTVGTYTSPHLIDIRERIAIDGHMIGYTDFTRLVKLLAGKLRRQPNLRPTFFEIMTAMALRHFADEAVDVAVLETGLGGRLDATNAVKPVVCGITQISYDHADVLGKDLVSIAREKAGIFKKNVPAISVEQTPEVAAVLRKVAEDVGTPLKFTGQEIEFSFRFEANRELGPHTRVCLTTPNHHYEHFAVPLQGEHQAYNCGLALALLDQLRASGFDIAEDRMVAGLAATQLAGRMELVWQEPRILLDGAHNASSMTALIKAVGAHVPYDSLVMIFGCAQDKDILGMLRQVNLGADKVIFTRARGNPRAMEPVELQHKFHDVSEKMAQIAPTLDDALQLASRAVSREDLIIVTGSFYLVGEAKKYLADLAEDRAKTAVNN